MAIDPIIDDTFDPQRPDGPSLSPSRASDFMGCPLLYRFRVIDKLPERPSIDAARGTVVHKVLEHLFDLPARERNHQRAVELIEPAWRELADNEPELLDMFGPDTTDLITWLDQCRDLLAQYFLLEDPTQLEPAEREVHVETQLDTGLRLHGYIDRVDIAPTGAIRIVDYKSGYSPGELFEAKALFQMKFYPLVVWRTRGVMPALLQLIYLGNSEILTYVPDEQSLLATERKVAALWAAIERATETGHWVARKSALCGWCDHQPICPAWGGTPPPLPDLHVDLEVVQNAVSASVEVAGDLDSAAAS